MSTMTTEPKHTPMTYDPTLLEQVPGPVIASARLVCEWFDANTQGHWALGGLCSRKHHDAILADNERLREALRGLLDLHAGLVSSGDCGFWDVETEPEVRAAKASDFKPGDRVKYVEFDGTADPGTVSSTNDKYVFVRFDRHVAKFGWDGATSQSCDPNDLHTLP